METVLGPDQDPSRIPDTQRENPRVKANRVPWEKAQEGLYTGNSVSQKSVGLASVML